VVKIGCLCSILRSLLAFDQQVDRLLAPGVVDRKWNRFIHFMLIRLTHTNPRASVSSLDKPAR